MSPQQHITETTGADLPVNYDFAAIRQQIPKFVLILAGGTLSVSGTSSAEQNRLWEPDYVQGAEATTSSPSMESRGKSTNDAESTRRAISELRRLSGLTWDQLGELFHVSRRSVHFWASGKPMNVSNEQRVAQILDAIRAVDRGDARSTRAALLEVKDGVSAFSLLIDGQFDSVRAMLGSGSPRPTYAHTQLSATAKAARKPLPPGELIDAQNERIHKDHDQSRAARSVRNKRRGSS